jgi:hypothetical protein
MPTLTPAWPLETARLRLRPFEGGELVYAILDREWLPGLYGRPQTLPLQVSQPGIVPIE